MAAESSEATVTAESAEATVTLSAVQLSGAQVWGPQAVPVTEPLDGLRGRIAAEMGHELWQVSLLKGEEAIHGTRTVGEAGLEDGDKLQVVVRCWDVETIKAIQSKMNVAVLPGLTDEQVAKAEAKYNFRFPPDARAFLQVGVPESWHNWHVLSTDAVELGSGEDIVSKQLLWNATPEKDMVFRRLRWRAGKEVPESFEKGKGKGMSKEEEEAVEAEVARLCELARRHPLIPLYGHRMIPTLPYMSGLPVLSMHQCSDNIVYGKNFWEWLERDNFVPEGTVPTEWKEMVRLHMRDVPFWEGLVQYWDDD